MAPAGGVLARRHSASQRALRRNALRRLGQTAKAVWKSLFSMISPSTASGVAPPRPGAFPRRCNPAAGEGPPHRWKSRARSGDTVEQRFERIGEASARQPELISESIGYTPNCLPFENRPSWLDSQSLMHSKRGLIPSIFQRRWQDAGAWGSERGDIAGQRASPANGGSPALPSQRERSAPNKRLPNRGGRCVV